jgi:hypothetical protein
VFKAKFVPTIILFNGTTELLRLREPEDFANPDKIKILLELDD